MPFPNALADLRDGARYAAHPGDRPRRLRLDSEGRGVSIEVPGPRVLATAAVGPWLVMRGIEILRPSSGAALLTRSVGSASVPSPVDMLALRHDLADDLRALPDRPDAGRPYRDVRSLVREASPAYVDAYLADAITAARRLAPTWAPAVPARPRREPLAEPDRVRQYRARVRADADATGREWLEAALGDGDLVPGDRIAAADLWERAHEDFLDFDGATDDEGNPTRTPGRSHFYALADDVLGPRRTIKGARYYFIPTPAEEAPVMHAAPTLADIVLDRVVAEIANEVREEIRSRLRSGDRVGALLAQRDAHRLARSGSAPVVDLGAVRAATAERRRP